MLQEYKQYLNIKKRETDKDSLSFFMFIETFYTMSCNCEGKNYNISMGCCEPVLAPIENYYTKYQIDKMIASAVTSGCCITPEEVDEKIEEAISGITVSGVTEEELNNAIASAKTEIEAEIPTVPTSNTAFTNDAGYLTEHQSLSGYATEQWVLDKNYITGVDLSNYATKDEIPTVPTKVSAFENDVPYLTEHQSLSGYATEQWVLDKHYISGVDLSDYALKSEIPTVPTKVSAFENDVPYLTEHQSLSGYVTDAEMSAFTYDKATIDEKVAQGGTFDPSQYYNTAQTNNLIESAVTRVEAEIPTVPTSNTAFTNDAGYLTEHQSLTAYSTTNEVNELINQSVSGKQDTLSAGTGISIVDNVISATGGGGTTYTAGRGIDITNDTISLNLGVSAGTSTNSIIQGSNTVATGESSHSEGSYTYAYGNYSHTEGTWSVTNGAYSHAEGSNTVTNNNYEHASGMYNTSNYGSTEADNTLFSIGNGTYQTRHNAFEVRQNGDIYFNNGTSDVKLQDELSSKASTTYVQNNYLLKSKIWCGTQSQYDSISNKDSETLYLIHE